MKWKDIKKQIKEDKITKSKVILSILGGIDVTIYMFTPIILAALWVTMNGLDSWGTYFFYIMGLFATLFRAIKIGFMK